MRLLLDTHAFYWAIEDETKLSPAALAAIQDPENDVFVSIVGAWEMAIKVGNGKWPEAAALLANFEKEIAVPAFVLLPITVPHVRTAGLMQAAHRDPFDRLLAAQAIAEGLTLVTADEKVQGLGAPWLW